MEIDKPKIEDYSVAVHDHLSDEKGGILSVLDTNPANLVWATPNGTEGTPEFRELNVSDINGTLPVSKGGTGSVTLEGILLGNGDLQITALDLPAGYSIRRKLDDTGYETYIPLTSGSNVVYNDGESQRVITIKVLSQAAYDAILSKDVYTLYVIV